MGLEQKKAQRVSEERLACHGITVTFGGLIALSDVDLAVPPGSIVGLIGPNGAGKSTLFGVMSGLLRPSHGQVLLHGHDVTEVPPEGRFARGMARTFQKPELFFDLTVREHFLLAHRARNAKRRLWSDMLTLAGFRSDRPDERSRIDALVELLGLGALAHRQVMGLPLGWARLVELGRALASSPTVLLLDEPSSGLDFSATKQFERTLRTVAVERGVSVLLVEHDVDLVMRLCSLVHVLDSGTLIASGPPDEIRANPEVRVAYLGNDASTGQTAIGRRGDVACVTDNRQANPPTESPSWRARRGSSTPIGADTAIGGGPQRLGVQRDAVSITATDLVSGG